MKSSLPTGQAGMTRLSHTGMTIYHARFHSLSRRVGMTFEKQLLTHEIEPAYRTGRDSTLNLIRASYGL
nr:hypothetical protein [Cytophagales bacterium]